MVVLLASFLAEREGEAIAILATGFGLAAARLLHALAADLRVEDVSAACHAALVGAPRRLAAHQAGQRMAETVVARARRSALCRSAGVHASIGGGALRVGQTESGSVAALGARAALTRRLRRHPLLAHRVLFDVGHVSAARG